MFKIKMSKDGSYSVKVEGIKGGACVSEMSRFVGGDVVSENETDEMYLTQETEVDNEVQSA